MEEKVIGVNYHYDLMLYASKKTKKKNEKQSSPAFSEHYGEWVKTVVTKDILTRYDHLLPYIEKEILEYHNHDIEKFRKNYETEYDISGPIITIDELEKE
jgi:hypothetical protein